MASAAGAAGAQGVPSGPELRLPMRTYTVPASATKQAEDAVRRDLGDPAGAKFRDVRAAEVASVRHAAFEEPVQGPVSIVCGQVGVPNAAGGYGGYSWFFVAIKRGQILWDAADKDGPGDAYLSCKGAGLTPDSPPRTMPDD
jgi:hypothetical protein